MLMSFPDAANRIKHRTIIPLFAMGKPLIPIPDGFVDFTKRIRNVSVRYLNKQKPTGLDLDKWVVVPLYQLGLDMPLDNDGKTALLLANIDVMRQMLRDYDRKMENDEKEKRTKKGENSTDSKSPDLMDQNVDDVKEAKKYLGLSSDDDEEKYGNGSSMADYGMREDEVSFGSKESPPPSSMISMDGIDDLVNAQDPYAGHNFE